jgi:hypothetical protein
MARWKLLIISVTSLSTLCAFTAMEAPKVTGPMDVFAWLLGAGWLALAFGLGTTYQQLRTLAARVSAIEQHGSPATAILTERVEAVKADVAEIKTAVGDIREALWQQARRVAAADWTGHDQG